MKYAKVHWIGKASTDARDNFPVWACGTVRREWHISSDSSGQVTCGKCLRTINSIVAPQT